MPTGQAAGRRGNRRNPFGFAGEEGISAAAPVTGSATSCGVFRGQTSRVSRAALAERASHQERWNLAVKRNPGLRRSRASGRVRLAASQIVERITVRVVVSLHRAPPAQFANWPARSSAIPAAGIPDRAARELLDDGADAEAGNMLFQHFEHPPPTFGVRGSVYFSSSQTSSGRGRCARPSRSRPSKHRRPHASPARDRGACDRWSRTGLVHD